VSPMSELVHRDCKWPFAPRFSSPPIPANLSNKIENHNLRDSLHERMLPHYPHLRYTPFGIVNENGNYAHQGNGRIAQSNRPQPEMPEPQPIVDSEAILRRFTDMLMIDFGAGRAVAGSPGSGGLFPAGGENAFRPVNRVHQTTVRTGPFGGRTSVTVTSRTIGGGDPDLSRLNAYVIPRGAHPHPGGRRIHAITIINNRAADANEPLRFFDHLFSDPGSEESPQGPRPLMSGLQQLMNMMYNPAAAAHGDAVFTDEALDRIVTRIMESSPMPNAAPPATQAAIEKLEKKRLDDEMLGGEGKAECTICIDEIKKGDEVLVLPCKHWYHGQCVTLWLKEHNTCPICRMPIENPSGSPDPRPFSASTRPTPERIGDPNPDQWRGVREAMARQDSIIRSLATGVRAEQPSSSSPQPQSSQSPPDVWPLPSESAEMARVSSRSSLSSRETDANGAGDGAGYDTRGRAPPVRMTSTMAQGVISWGGGRQLTESRQRSESPPQPQTRRQSQHQTQPQSSSGNGPFGWLRDHFGRRSS
jgi:hypothetical protein